jgi:hypothetical protein
VPSGKRELRGKAMRTIRRLSSVFLLLFASTSLAGWFGEPDSAEECIDEYSIPAKTGEAAGLASRLCRQLFSNARLSESDQAQHWCVLKQIHRVEVRQSLGILVQRCRAEFPPPDQERWLDLPVCKSEKWPPKNNEIWVSNPSSMPPRVEARHCRPRAPVG